MSTEEKKKKKLPPPDFTPFTQQEIEILNSVGKKVVSYTKGNSVSFDWLPGRGIWQGRLLLASTGKYDPKAIVSRLLGPGVLGEVLEEARSESEKLFLQRLPKVKVEITDG